MTQRVYFDSKLLCGVWYMAE